MFESFSYPKILRRSAEYSTILYYAYLLYRETPTAHDPDVAAIKKIIAESRGDVHDPEQELEDSDLGFEELPV